VIIILFIILARSWIEQKVSCNKFEDHASITP
jgi:hypothetical protein